MILSHSKQFIFIHNYKVAGTSVRNALKNYNNKSFWASNLNDKIQFITGNYPKVYAKQFAHHIKAPELQGIISEDIFTNYFKFGFVRNPWDWQVSLYKFMLKREKHRQHELVKNMKSFDEYIDWRVHEDLHLQKEFFYVEDTCLMDFIGKMENLNDDFEIICKKIGVTSELKHLNSSRKPSDSFLRYYSQKSIDLVFEGYQEDIKLFGYTKPEMVEA
ncbi:MAG: sulfotransferase family 2 domain-containing protein [Bacteroidota bacterium]